MPVRIVNKRKPGQRAGMSQSKIATAASQLWAEVGPDNFTIRKVARKLKVGPTTIHAHFEGGLGQLRREVARRALANLTPPYEPKQDPKDYLRAFLRSSLSSFRKQAHIGRLVVMELTNDPFLNPVFAERMGATIRALNEGSDLITALELFIARWAGLVLVEIGAWARQDPDTARSNS